MQTGYYASAAGMVTQFNRLDTISNNLANVNTAGFKEDNLVIGDFMRVFKEARDEMPNANNTEEGAAFINRTMTRAPQVTDSFTNHSVGTIEKTSNDLDFALSSEGLFFVVKTPQGVKLTRDGSFTKNDEGTLVTKQGYEVLQSNGEKISLAQEDSVISADKNGNIYTNIPGGVKMNQNSSLFIAEPKDVALLKKEGDNLYAFENIDDLNAIDNSGALSQGYIEKRIAMARSIKVLE